MIRILKTKVPQLKRLPTNSIYDHKQPTELGLENLLWLRSPYHHWSLDHRTSLLTNNIGTRPRILIYLWKLLPRMISSPRSNIQREILLKQPWAKCVALSQVYIPIEVANKSNYKKHKVWSHRHKYKHRIALKLWLKRYWTRESSTSTSWCKVVPLNQKTR